MTTEYMSDGERASAIEEQFPSWGVWRSDTGAWWGSLREPLTIDQLTAGCTPFVRADDADELVGLLLDREDLMSRAVAP